MTTATTTHEITEIDSDERAIAWACACGWSTIEYRNAPSYHTPIDVRKADHLADAEAIESGRAYVESAASARGYELYVGHSAATKQSWYGIRAVWMGGFRTVAHYPIGEGFPCAEAIRSFTAHWCQGWPLIWSRGGYPVTAEDIARIKG